MKHEPEIVTLREIVDGVNPDSCDPWYVIMGVEIAGLHSLTHAEQGIDAARLEEDYLAIHGHELYTVSWPEHVLTPKYNGDAFYQPAPPPTAQTERKHTPLPWIMLDDDRGHDPPRAFTFESDTASRKVQRWRAEDRTRPQDAFGGVRVARLGMSWNGSGIQCGPIDGLMDQEELEANRDFLELACNSHYKLIEAFQHLINNSQCKCSDQKRAICARCSARQVLKALADVAE